MVSVCRSYLRLRSRAAGVPPTIRPPGFRSDPLYPHPSPWLRSGTDGGRLAGPGLPSSLGGWRLLGAAGAALAPGCRRPPGRRGAALYDGGGLGWWLGCRGDAAAPRTPLKRLYTALHNQLFRLYICIEYQQKKAGK